MIRSATLEDAPVLAEIYNRYITDTRITFEEIPVTCAEMEQRIVNVTKDYPWFVFEEMGLIVGYSYASRWKERSAYRHSVETGTYLHHEHVGKGIGTLLRTALIHELRARSIHCVICGVALPNPASIALCEKLGFTKVAHFKEVGFKLGQWVDVGYWQLIL